MFGATPWGDIPFGATLQPRRAIVEAGADLSAADVPAVRSVAIALGAGNLTAVDALAGPTRPRVFSAGVIDVGGTMDVQSATGEPPPVYVPVEPALQPLAASAEADELEAELKALFMLMFERHVRPDERYVNVLGMPQHGPPELVNESLLSDGLSIYRGADASSGAGAYLLRAWRAMNPKRGLHLLETYLQLLWPNVWSADQMWMSKAPGAVYPNALSKTDGGNHYLTSRVNVRLPARVTTGGDLASIEQGLRASVPARIVLNLAIETEESIGLGVAAVMYAGAVVQTYEGDFI